MNKFLVKCTVIHDDKTMMTQTFYDTENNRFSTHDVDEITLRFREECDEMEAAVFFDLIYKMDV